MLSTEIDFQALFEQCGEDPELFAEIVGMFRDGWKESYEKIVAAGASGVPVAVVHAAHYLKGTARSLYAPRVQAITAVMEVSARGGDIGPAVSALPALLAALESLDQVLSQPLPVLLGTKPTA